jgi:hypothetical protein
MNNKQVEEVIKAILARKYSWACVLMLRFNGYDPVQYIPYRTYIRLIKENYQGNREKPNEVDSGTLEFFDFKSGKVCLVEQGNVNNGKHDSKSIPVGQCQQTT